MKRVLSLAMLILLASSASFAQFGGLAGRLGDKLDKAKQAKQTTDDFSPWTDEQEMAIGKAAAAKMVHIFGISDDPAEVKYVNLVGNAVAQWAPRNVTYHFAILNTDAVTAFALPGGFVFVTRGALQAMKSEAELAGVLAHEVVHVDGRHLEKQIKNKKASAWALKKASSQIPGPSELRDIANDVVGNALTMSYSQDKETDADKRGTQFASKAGYDSHGLLNLLTTLKAREDDPETKRSLGLWNSTHPPLGERIATLTPIANGFGGGQTLEPRYEAAMKSGDAKAAEKK